MKKQLFSFILAGFLLLSLITFAQKIDYPVTTINGFEYYQYTVLPSEGLLAIGRKFKISADSISKANPEIKNGLQIGQQILIPIPQNKEKKQSIQKSTLKEFIQYKVDKRQTLFSICRKFNVSEEDLLKYNPVIKNGLKEGIVLQIPKYIKEKRKNDLDNPSNKNTEKKPTDKTDKKPKFVIHIVQQDETLFSISRRYKVDIPVIIQFNPGSDSKLVAGTELKIPLMVQLKSKEQKKDTLINGSKSIKEQTKSDEKTNSLPHSNNPIKIAFLLPLMLDQPKNDPSVERFVNFYAGSLLAIKEAKQRGISFEIYTYDTEKTEDRVKDILNKAELKTMDLIIGPAFSNQVSLVGDFAKANKINTLIPFTSKVPDIDSNPYLFQFNPGQDSELSFISDLITRRYKNMHIVFAEIQDINPLDDAKIRFDALKKQLESRSSSIDLTSAENTNFNNVLKKGEKNLIIFNTDKFTTVSPYINLLASLLTRFDIVLFEQFHWKNQSEKTPQSMYVSPFITKFNPVLVNEFNLQFNQYFGKDLTNETPRYDLLGYDLSNYFISLIHQYGNKFGNKINTGNLKKGIQSEPLFERASKESGFINQRIYLGEDKAH